MTKNKENQNMFISLILAVIIIIAIVVVIYFNLPEESNDGDIIDDETILTINYGSKQQKLTLKEIENLDTLSGTARYIKWKALKSGTVIFEPSLDEDAWEFTGVLFTDVIKTIPELPEEYTVTAIGSDGYAVDYIYDQINGEIPTYNESGVATNESEITMILAYKQDGNYLTDPEIGPFRIVFIGDEPITPSNIWAKMVTTIEITDV